MLVVKNVSYEFPRGPVLTFPDWTVASNQHSLILGPSGGGKTTFLHLLGGLLRPKTGSIFLRDCEIQDMSSSALDHFRGAHIGFVFQRPHLLHSLTVLDNIRLATFFGRKSEHTQRIDDVMQELGIGELKKRKAHEISQGQAQRVAIARAVINQPDVIFGDEPTASLDDESCETVIQLLKKQAEKCHATLIIATHDHRVKSQFKNQLRL